MIFHSRGCGGAGQTGCRRRCPRIICTDISRDGTSLGVNTEETLRLARAVKIPIIASGGVASLDDIRRLKELEKDGVEGVIVGRALYSSAFTLREAIAVGKSEKNDKND